MSQMSPGLFADLVLFTCSEISLLHYMHTHPDCIHPYSVLVHICSQPETTRPFHLPHIGAPVRTHARHWLTPFIFLFLFFC